MTADEEENREEEKAGRGCLGCLFGLLTFIVAVFRGIYKKDDRRL
ncbi:MAG: hypothetical protein ACYC5K_11385 [Saccharofermentanales bacterium]